MLDLVCPSTLQPALEENWANADGEEEEKQVMRESRGNFLFPSITQRLTEWALFLTRENVLLVISNCNVTSIVFILLLFEKAIKRQYLESRPLKSLLFPFYQPKGTLTISKVI